MVKPKVRSSLWEQTIPAAITVPYRVQADTSLNRYLEEDPIDSNADSLAGGATTRADGLYSPKSPKSTCAFAQ